MVDTIPPESPFEPVEAAARYVLRAYGLDADSCRIDRPAEARGFSGALILRVREGERTWCLRRWPAGGLPPERLLALHHFLRYLKSCEIVVLAVPTAGGSGGTLVEHNHQWWQLEPWLAGRADFLQQPSEQRLRSAMQTLGQIHLAAERYETPPAGRQWFGRHPASTPPALRERLQIIRDWSPARCDQALADLEAKAPAEFRHPAREVLHCFQIGCGPIERELRFLHELPLPVHPCLRDIWHDHVLFTGEAVTGVVDPSAARTANVASDLSRLLGSLLEDDRPRWETALEAYHEVRPLSLEERRLIAALDRSSVLLSGLTWIGRWLQGQIEEEDLPRVLPRLESIRRRLAALAESLAP